MVMNKPQVLDHIDPLNSDHICGFRVESNELEVDSSYNLKKNNRFVPYKTTAFPKPIFFGDTCEFLINGEWVVTEFGGPIWMEESRRIGFSSTKAIVKTNEHLNTAAARSRNVRTMIDHPNSIEGRIRGGKTSAEQLNSHPNTIAVRSTNGKLYGGKKKKPVLCVETGAIYESVKEAAKQNNLWPGNISACCRGKLNTTGGYHWEFV